ncbi:hypothetical protein [Nocardioides solisilvae]|uniref:hypothetical protein n=1 Tax=Nocardioides solisilvae TaxID=1542435 RepID=UPI000D740278|nr:hypothetical protein [Nocardioides solisilvae]
MGIRATYFSLRIGLVACTVLVLLAPLAVRVADGAWPPTISDTWYTDARTLFVLAVAAAACLLLAVRGDTLTEQTLLNVAGGLGMLVAAAACWPKDSSGEHLPAHDPAVVRLNAYAVGALLAVGLLLWVVSVVLLPRAGGDVDDWRCPRRFRRVLRGAPAVLLVALLVAFAMAPGWVSRHVHEPAAVAMFVLLGGVALLRTTLGLRLLERLGDVPAEQSPAGAHLRRAPAAGRRMTGLDAVYGALALGMVAVVALAAVLLLVEAPVGWVLLVEALLLVLFATFWAVQTWEVWGETGVGA